MNRQSDATELLSCLQVQTLSNTTCCAFVLYQPRDAPPPEYIDIRRALYRSSCRCKAKPDSVLTASACEISFPRYLGSSLRLGLKVETTKSDSAHEARISDLIVFPKIVLNAYLLQPTPRLGTTFVLQVNCVQSQMLYQMII